MRPIPLPATDGVSDAELVARAVPGDRWAREVLYRRHAGYLFGLATRLLASRGEAEEVVQDTFVLGLGQLGTLREPAAVRAWLAQIAVSLVRRRLRRSRVLRFVGLEGGEHDAALFQLAAPDLPADERAELALVDRVLGGVRNELRIAWMLRRVEGLDLAAVASTVGCSLATVKRRITEVDAVVERHRRGGRAAS